MVSKVTLSGEEAQRRQLAQNFNAAERILTTAQQNHLVVSLWVADGRFGAIEADWKTAGTRCRMAQSPRCRRLHDAHHQQYGSRAVPHSGAVLATCLMQRFDGAVDLDGRGGGVVSFIRP